MTTKPSIILQPCQNTYAAILSAFAADKPLTAAQINFLLWHAKQLSNVHFDPIIRAYKIGKSCMHSFLVADELDTVASIHCFKEKLENILQEQKHGIMAKFTQTQFAHLIAIEQITQFIYFDGNNIVVDSPIIRGKKAHAYFFQWGNMIGIVKYEMVHAAPIAETNTLVYFEERNKRELTEVMHNFYLKYTADFDLINKQQMALQQQLKQFNLEKERINKALIEKELVEKQDYLNHLPHNEPHFNPSLEEQERALNEKLYQDEVELEEILEAEKSDFELIEQERLEQEELKQEKLEEIKNEYEEIEKKHVKQQRIIQEKHKEKYREEPIPDLHKEFKSHDSSVSPPCFQLKNPAPHI